MMQDAIERLLTDPNLPILRLPEGKQQLLVHSCCAPCASDIMVALVRSEIPYTIFFYNPNIHPRPEYELRKEENIRFAERFKIPFVDADYDPNQWFKRVKGQEWEPERGARCSACFDMRFEGAAFYADAHGFDLMTSTLGISRWKNMDQINESGKNAVKPYANLAYWDYNWRKDGGSQRMIEISKALEFYQQEYCGCVYSLRDTNAWRVGQGRDPIKIGVNFYRDAKNDSNDPSSLDA